MERLNNGDIVAEPLVDDNKERNEEMGNVDMNKGKISCCWIPGITESKCLKLHFLQHGQIQIITLPSIVDWIWHCLNFHQNWKPWALCLALVKYLALAYWNFEPFLAW